MTHRPRFYCCGRPRPRLLSDLRALLVLLGALLLVLPPRVGRAAEPAEVETLIRQGVQLRTQGRDALALPLFQRAYDLERTPRTAAQLGLAEFAMGYWLASERHLSEALASPRHPWVAKNRPYLERSLKEVRASVGELEIVGTPAGAEILINGKAEGVLPRAAPVRVNDGMAQVTVRAPGFEELRTTVQVLGGKRERVNVKLVRTKTAAVAVARGADPAPDPDRSFTAPPLPPPPGGGRPDLSAKPAAPEPASGSAPSWVRPAAWITGGLAVVSLAVGGYGLYDMKQHEDRFNTRPSPSTGGRECSTDNPTKGSPFCKTLYDRTVSSQRLGLIGLQAGGLLAAASVVAFLWSADDSSELALAAPTGLVAGSDGDGLSASWRMRF